MVRFKIEPKAINRSTVYVVLAFNYMANAWIFQQAFVNKERAEHFIHNLKTQIKKGDFSCLTLRS